MCFFKEPKSPKPKKATTRPPVSPAPVAVEQPQVETGVTRATEKRKQKRPTPGAVSLFELALLPGASFWGVEGGPGAATDGSI